jgi:hypothetical protein
MSAKMSVTLLFGPAARAAMVFAVLLAKQTSVAAEPDSLDPSQIAQLETCIETVSQELSDNSVSVCRGNTETFATRGAIDVVSQSINYTLGNGLENYRWIEGTAFTKIESGTGNFRMQATFVNAVTLQCTWIAIFGNSSVSGYCGAKVRYLVQPADTDRVKAYCFAQLLGIPTQKPNTHPIGCAQQTISLTRAE